MIKKSKELYMSSHRVRPTKFLRTLQAKLISILYPEKEVILASPESHITFKNGSVIKTIKTDSKPARGKRANMLTYWSDMLDCFVEYDGNKPEFNQCKYFILDNNDEKVYIKKPEEI